MFVHMLYKCALNVCKTRVRHVLHMLCVTWMAQAIGTADIDPSCQYNEGDLRDAVATEKVTCTDHRSSLS